LTKNSATAIIFFCKKSPSNRMENCLIFTCFLSNDWGSPYLIGDLMIIFHQLGEPMKSIQDPLGVWRSVLSLILHR